MKLACPSCRVLLDLPDECRIVECPCGEILVFRSRISGRELRLRLETDDVPCGPVLVK